MQRAPVLSVVRRVVHRTTTSRPLCRMAAAELSVNEYIIARRIITGGRPHVSMKEDGLKGTVAITQVTIFSSFLTPFNSWSPLRDYIRSSVDTVDIK